MGEAKRRIVNVMERDRESSERKWKAKGWVVMRVVPAAPIDALKPHVPTVDLHLQKP